MIFLSALTRQRRSPQTVLPGVQQAAHRRRQAQRQRGLNMVALSIDKTPDEARAYLHKRGYTFPAAWAFWRRQRGCPRRPQDPFTR